MKMDMKKMKKVSTILITIGALFLVVGISYLMLPALAVTYGPAYPGTTMAFTGISSVTCTPTQTVGGAVNIHVGVKDFHKAGQGYDFRVTITDEDTGAVLDTSWMGHVYAYETAGHDYVFVMPNKPWNLKVEASFSGDGSAYYPGDTNNPAFIAIDLTSPTIDIFTRQSDASLYVHGLLAFSGIALIAIGFGLQRYPEEIHAFLYA